MPNPGRRFTAALGCFLGSFALATPAVVAQESHRTSMPFSIASFEGDYAVLGTYGANVARLLGTYHAGGRGNLKGSAKVNLPGANGERVVASITFEGTCNVNDDGTGVINFTVTLPGGTTMPVTLDLLITRAEVFRGMKIATEIATSQREPSSVVDGQFVTHVSTRRPDTVHDRDRF